MRWKPGREDGEGKREVLVGPSGSSGLAGAATDQAALLPTTTLLGNTRRTWSRALGSAWGRGGEVLFFLMCIDATKQLLNTPVRFFIITEGDCDLVVLTSRDGSEDFCGVWSVKITQGKGKEKVKEVES